MECTILYSGDQWPVLLGPQIHPLELIINDNNMAETNHLYTSQGIEVDPGLQIIVRLSGCCSLCRHGRQ